jgi:hypothetical protein
VLFVECRGACVEFVGDRRHERAGVFGRAEPFCERRCTVMAPELLGVGCRSCGDVDPRLGVLLTGHGLRVGGEIRRVLADSFLRGHSPTGERETDCQAGRNGETSRESESERENRWRAGLVHTHR